MYAYIDLMTRNLYGYCMDWSPTIHDRLGPVYVRILDALTEDIASGRLHRGQQLPTHRALANTLGVDLTTITRAYGEARRRGLTDARVGQGTFVADGVTPTARMPDAGRDIDLSMNLPPQPAEADLDGRMLRGLAAIERETGLAAYLNYRQPGGADEDRGLAAEWLQPRVKGARRDNLVISPGTQTALMSLLLTLTRRGDVVLCESLTYPGFKAAAGHIGLRLAGVVMDRDGIVPDALDAACRRHKAKVIYLVPTIHNPTTATMPPARRERIAAIIASHDMILIEDDAYGLLDAGSIPLASLIPERTYLAESLSKCIAPGLRTSFVVTPDRDAAAGLVGALAATAQMPVPLIVALVTRWIGDGSADTMIEAIAAEAAARQKLAAKALSGYTFAAHPRGHHIWLPLPGGGGLADFATRLHRLGLAVVTSDAFGVDKSAPPAVRVALGAARDRAELMRALEVLATTLKAPAAGTQIV